jgi:predicted PurR-regulated permease PerM
MAIQVQRIPWDRSSVKDSRRLLLVGLVLLSLWLLGKVVLLVFAASLLAILLSAPARWFSEHSNLGYGWSLALVVGIILAVLGAIGVALAPEVSRQIDQLSTELPHALNHVMGGVQSSGVGRALLGQLKSGGGRSASSLGGPLLKSMSSLFVAAGSIVFGVFVGLYFAATPDLYERGLLRLVPEERCPRVQQILEAVGTTLRYFLFGRLFSMSVIAGLSIAGLWALGIPAPIALGLLAGVLSFVPYVGSAASGVPPFLLAYVHDPLSGLYVIVLYLGIHVLDSYILVPLVQRRMVHLLPAVTLTAQLVLGILWGLLGVSVATPMAAALMTALEMGYVDDALHKGGQGVASSAEASHTAEPAVGERSGSEHRTTNRTS